MNTEDRVKKLLEEHFKMNVTKIPASEKKTPDFYVTDSQNEYLIEVKEKEENPEIRKKKDVAFSKDTAFRFSEALEPKSVLQTIIRDARRQIKSYAKNETVLRIVWVHCTGIAFDATFEQIISGLYGTETVVDISSKQSQCRTCYYFGFSQFFKYHDSIDAVMVSGRDGHVSLCINNYSPRYEYLMDSSLVKLTTGGIRNPLDEEKEGVALIADTDIDRSSPDDVLVYLQEKYNTEKFGIMKFKQAEIHQTF